MPHFKKFKTQFQKHIDTMLEHKDRIFLTDVDKQIMWDTYLESFPEGTNNVYRERREFDCNCCKNFIRNYGNMVTVSDGKLISIWDIPELDEPFRTVSAALSGLVKSAPIRDIFVTKFRKLGTDSNHDMDIGTVTMWEHLFYHLPKHYVTEQADSIEAIKGPYRDAKNTFKRALTELTMEAGLVILELIEQNSLYRGEEFKGIIQLFLQAKKNYNRTPDEQKDNWLWVNSIGNPVSHVRNSAIGTLLIDLSENVEVDTAVTKFEKVMAPANYKRPQAIFTKKMVEAAQEKIEELGFTDSLARRFAHLDDITVNNILFVNRDVRKKLGGVSVFDDLKESIPENSKKFSKVEEVAIADFVKDILPTTTSLELMLENKHQHNMVSLIAPQNSDAPTMFKWNNNFSWAYAGDIADSDIKKNVKNAGGNVEGVLRFSIQWNAGSHHNKNDFDAHCVEPAGTHIYYGNKGREHNSSGMLDVDIINPANGVPAVENIVWTDADKMPEGDYRLYVNNYAHRGSSEGFSAEIEFNGSIYSYEYPRELKQAEEVTVAMIRYNRKEGFSFVTSLESSVSSKEIWGVPSQKFTKVSVMMYSPNYWDGQESSGNRHYFFMLDSCRNEGTPRGFFNEFLKEDLTAHRKVFEALGSKMRVAEDDNQLSGVGFSSTQRNSVLVRVEGAFSRVVKLIF